MGAPGSTGVDSSGLTGSDNVEREDGQSVALPDPGTIRGDDHILDGEGIEDLGNERQRVKQNFEAIELLFKLEIEDRAATKAEQAVLAKYVGWGGLKKVFGNAWGGEAHGWETEYDFLKDLLSEEEYAAAKSSMQNAHYTTPAIIEAMYSALDQFGVTGRVRVLEAGAGVGNFIGLSPLNARWTAVEKDSITARILGKLYPSVQVHEAAYENVTLPDGSYDLAIGNPPFGPVPIYDPKYGKKIRLRIHDYFFVKGLDKLRPGGVMAYVTSTGTLDKGGQKARIMMSDRADFLGAIRLPAGTFGKTANTDVTTDIIFLQKRELGAAPNHVGGFIESVSLEAETTKQGSLPLLIEPGTDLKDMWLNEYFLAHPDMMLGNLSRDTLSQGVRAGLTAFEGHDLTELLGKAIEKLPSGIFQQASVTQETQDLPGDLPAGSIEGQWVVKDKGVWQIKDGKLTDLGIKTERVLKLVKMGDAARNVVNLSRDNATDEVLEKAQKALEKMYDAFVHPKSHGPINLLTKRKNPKGGEDIETRPNLARYKDPVNGPLVKYLLERYDDETGVAEKTDIFTQRMHGSLAEVGKIDTAWKAVVTSHFMRGVVDMNLMVELYGKTEEEIVEELGEAIFQNPSTGLYETRETYASGNVRDKLALAVEAAKADASFQKNVDVLTKSIPADVTVSQLRKQNQDVEGRYLFIGSQWISIPIYKEFVREVFGIRNPTMNFREIDGGWQFTRDGAQVLSRSKMEEFRVGDGQGGYVDVYRLFRDLLNGRRTKVTNTDSAGNSFENTAASAQAEEVKFRMQERFGRWALDDDLDRTGKLMDLYNVRMNHTVVPKWDGSHLQGRLPGVASHFRGSVLEFRDFQYDAIWQFLSNGNMIIAQDVGAGKTMEMVVMSMEAKRMGLAKKPVHVVLNSMLPQYRNEFLEIYPAAKLLVADEDSFKPKNRGDFLAQWAAGDWDAVLITHSQLISVRNHPNAERQVVARLLAEYQEVMQQAVRDGEAQYTTTKIQTAIDTYTQRLAQLTDVPDDSTQLYFEDMGSDLMFVDEAHEFKNLDLPTASTAIALSTAQKTTDLYIKTRTLEQMNPGRGIVFATATPVSNSIAELYVMLRYVAERHLQDQGYGSFNAWTKNFVASWVEPEYTSVGTLEQKFRARGYQNTFALAQMFRRYANVMTPEDLVGLLTLPPIIGGKEDGQIQDVIVPGSQGVRDLSAALLRRWESKPPMPQHGQDSVFSIILDGRYGSYASAMVTSVHAQHHGHDPSKPWKYNKSEFAAKTVFKVWKDTTEIRGVQLVFSDLGVPQNYKQYEINAIIEDIRKDKPDLNDEELRAAAIAKLGESEYDFYNELKAQLVKAGIPSKEIAFIQEGKGDKKKKEAILKRAREGKIRVLIGSTMMMGQGVNVQDRLVALHDIDVPWKPAWLHQRHGRILRQGNKLYDEGLIEGVQMFRYILEGSFDQRSWQIIYNKIGFIHQIMNASPDSGVIAEIAGSTMSEQEIYAELRALSSENPYAIDHAKVAQRLRVLMNSHEAFLDSQKDARLRIGKFERYLRELQDTLQKAKKDVDSRWQDVSGDKFTITLGGNVYTDRKAAGQEIIRRFNKNIGRGGAVNSEKGLTLGKFGGFNLSVSLGGMVNSYAFHHTGSLDYMQNAMMHEPTFLGVMGVIGKAHNEIKEFPAKVEDKIEKALDEVRESERIVNEPFPQAADLEQTRIDYAELERQMQEFRPDQLDDSEAWPEHQSEKWTRKKLQAERRYRILVSYLENATPGDIFSINDPQTDVDGFAVGSVYTTDEGFTTMDMGMNVVELFERAPREKKDGTEADDMPALEKFLMEHPHEFFPLAKGDYYRERNGQLAIDVEHADIAFGSMEAQDGVAREVFFNSGNFTEVVGDLDPMARFMEVENMESPKAFVDIRGQEIRSHDDVYKLMAPFRSKRTETWHVLFTKKGKIIGHYAVTSGVIDHVMMPSRYIERFARMAKFVGADGVTMAHNHPSGNVTSSLADRILSEDVRTGLNKVGIKNVDSVIINHNKYLDIFSDKEGQLAGTKAEPQKKVIGRASDAAELFASLHNDKKMGYVLYLDTQNQAVAMEPHTAEELEDLSFIEERTKLLGAARVIIGVSGSTRQMRVVTAAKAKKLTGTNWSKAHGVLDVVNFAVQGGTSAADMDQFWTTRGSESVSGKAGERVRYAREQGPFYGKTPEELKTTRNALALEVSPGGTFEGLGEPESLISNDFEGDYIEASKVLVRALGRNTRYRVYDARKSAKRWEKVLSEEQLEDIGAFIEGIGNIRTGKGYAEVQREVNKDRVMKAVAAEYRKVQDKARNELNAFLEDIHGTPEYIKYVEDYILHMYVGRPFARKQFAARFSRNVRSAAQRKFPTLEQAIEAGFTPRTQNVASLHKIWAEINWKAAINQRFVSELRGILNEDQLPIIQKVGQAPADWEKVNHPAIRRIYAKKLANGKTVLSEGDAMVDPEAYKILRQVFMQPFTGNFIRSLESFIAYAKKSALSISFFHHITLTGSAQGGLAGFSKARHHNPLRGLFLLQRDLLGGIKLGPKLRLTTPHREGLRIVAGMPGFMRDAMLTGVSLDPIPDVMAGRVVQGLTNLEARTREIPGLGWFTRTLRQANTKWDEVLWNRYYTGLKAYTYYSMVGEVMARMPEGTSPEEVFRVRQEIAKAVNNMYGGQEWDGKFWLHPKARQFAHIAMLAPDWTNSNWNVAMEPVKTLATIANDDSAWLKKEKMKMYGYYWRNMMMSYLAILATANRFCTRTPENPYGIWSGDNEPGQQGNIDVTCLMKRVAKIVPDWLPDWIPGADPDDSDPNRRFYIRPAKQFREVPRWFTEPITLLGAKLSPLFQVILEQMTGHQAGRDGWAMPWTDEDLRWYQNLGHRGVSVMAKFVPFALRGSNFMLAMPLSKGMSWYKAQKGYEDLIRAQVDPDLYDRLMSWKNAEKLKAEIDAGAVANGLDPVSLYSQANTNVRTMYYQKIWREIHNGNEDKAVKAAKILVELGVTAQGIKGSGTRKGAPLEDVNEALRLTGNRQVRPSRPKRPSRPSRPTIGG